MNKYICIREAYDWIYVGESKNELIESEFDELVIYLEEKKDGFKYGIIEIKYKKLRVINYVGIISLSTVTIEILPKISLSNSRENDKEILLQMLSKCDKLKFKINERLSSNLKKYNLIDLLARFFLNQLKIQIDRGIYYEYITMEENLNLIKGKLLLKKHIRENYANKVKAYCQYEEYSKNNFLNKVYKKVCTIILRRVNNDEVKNEAKKILSFFEEVSVEYIDKKRLIKYKLHRQNNRYRESYEFAKLILLNMSMENSIGDDNAFSMLFEMNALYEEYISNLVCQLWNNKYRDVLLKDRSKYLLNNSNTNRGNFNLEPDIILSDKITNVEIIIDTKWKSSDSKIEQSDIYQMYAYITRYTKANKCILLYPFNNEVERKEYSKWRLFEPFIEKNIIVETIRLDDINYTIEKLKNLLEINNVN